MVQRILQCFHFETKNICLQFFCLILHVFWSRSQVYLIRVHKISPSKFLKYIVAYFFFDWTQVNILGYSAPFRPAQGGLRSIKKRVRKKAWQKKMTYVPLFNPIFAILAQFFWIFFCNSVLIVIFNAICTFP